MRYRNIGLKFSCIVLVLFICISFWTNGRMVFANAAAEKYFHEMTQDEKNRVLENLISTGLVPNTIKVKGKTYSFNITNWNNSGVITYGTVATVNAENQNTYHPNLKDGQWRYLGYDMNGGLYGNDNFPPDYPGGGAPQNKNWKTIEEIKNIPSARSLIGNSTISASDDISMADKIDTASIFLLENQSWVNKGWTAKKIAEYFLFNAVVSHNGLTQGQFVGVHDVGGGTYRYQTFSVQIKVRFIVPPEEDPPDPDPGPIEPGGEEPVTPPDPSVDVSINCVLGLPSETYTGHPALAQDYSLYNVDGDIYSSTRAYAEGIASNSFTSTGGSVSRVAGSDTRANVIFNNQGRYNVKLTVNPKAGDTASDIKAIDVYPTPKIIHKLTGTQKQNRKQVLNLSVAKHPLSSLTDFWVRIECLDWDEGVTLHNKIATGANTLSNSERIKTRPIERNPDSDKYYEHCKLEFLLKNTDPVNCRYTVYVKDSLGNVDEIREDFSVAPDKPPQAEVFLEGAYIRQANSNVAEIIAEDITASDGDQIERSWFYRSTEEGQVEEDKDAWAPVNPTQPGYTDYSFGTGKKIGFPKEGVGLFEVKLIAKDLWTEETLPEYVTEADRLSGEQVSRSEVLNIAPIISLKPLSLKAAEITILAGGQSEYELVKSKQTCLEMDLMQEGIDAKIRVDKMMPVADEASVNQAAIQTLEVRTPFGYQGNWLFYEDSNFIVDDECLYKIDATWPDTPADAYPEPPYTISCWNWNALATDNTKWTYTFDDNLFNVPNVRTGSYLAQDDKGKYLYFVSDGRTLIVSKDNGSFLTTLNMEVGKNSYVGGDKIYTIKTDGIYSISVYSGEITRIYNGPIIDGQYRRLDGRVHFLAGNETRMFRGLLDTDAGGVTLECLDFQPGPLGNTLYEVLGIDIDGKVIVSSSTRLRGSDMNIGSSFEDQIFVYGRDNYLLFSTPVIKSSSSGTNHPVMISDEGGKCNYVSFTSNSRSSSRRYVHADVYGINKDYYQRYSIELKGSDYPSVYNKIPFAKEISGKVYICTGAEWVYVWQTGTGIYKERTKLFVFDPENNTASEESYHDIGINLSTIEHGRSSDTIAGVQSGYNFPGAGYSINFILKWKQSLQQILDRYISKNFMGKDQINALVIYDETNSASSYTEDLLDKLQLMADERNGRFIQASRTDLEGPGLFNAIIAMQEDEKNLLGISVDDQDGGRVSKTYRLNPNKTYYYEYEIKSQGDVDQYTPTINYLPERTGGAEFSSETYYTVDSFFEDFQSEDTNPFFDLNSALVAEGYYKGATVVQSNNKNRYDQDPWPEDATAITFTIPEGKQGFLSFDYLMGKRYENPVGRWMQCYVKIDGDLWKKRTPATSGTGHYNHPQLLGAGTHKITMLASEYGTRETAMMWLDSIRVDLLEKACDLPEPKHEILSIQPLSGEYKKVKGSFKTLPKIGSFGEVENAQAIDLPIGEAPYIVWTNTDPDRKEFRIDVPEGKAAIHPWIGVVAYPRYSGGRWYQVRFWHLSDMWEFNASDEYPESAMHNCPLDNYDLILERFTTPQSIRLTADSYRYTSADFSTIKIVFVDHNNQSWEDLSYFYEGANDSFKYFLQKDESKDTEFIFNLPKGSSFIRNFKIYSIEDGRPVYADESAFSSSASLAEWESENASIAIIKEALAETEESKLIYKKNQLISYDINYFDFEGDPSKKQYWKYTHLPFNDGSHPDAAVIINDDNEPVTITGKVLNTPIQRFSIDGKYIVDHWQEDNTTRPINPGGNPNYDKLSNVESLVFYVQGAGSAPWVKSIKTLAAKVKEGDDFKILVEIDDAEKDPLQLITEVYFNKEMIYRHKRVDITAGISGNYPTVETDYMPFPARQGTYEVVCTVSDDTGVGLASYKFVLVSQGKIEGMVYHTDEWDKNRKKYNLNFFGTEFNQEIDFAQYVRLKVPRKRGTNVFWSGERFMLTAHVAGSPVRVTAEIIGYPAFKTALVDRGDKNSLGERIYKGNLWDRTMLGLWGRDAPQLLKVLFTAEYKDGLVKTCEVEVIVDSRTDYWLLHRLW